jgi:hypothetical protein
MFISPEEIRSDFLLLSCHAQPYLLARAQPSGSKGIGRYTPESRAVLQCDEADRRVKNRAIAVMERRGRSQDSRRCGRRAVRVAMPSGARRCEFAGGEWKSVRAAKARLLFVEHVVDGRVRSGRITHGVAGRRARP